MNNHIDKLINNKFNAFFQNLMGIAVLATICIVTFGVGARLCNIAVAWTDEIVRIIFIWLVFIGGAVAYSSDSLIGLDLVEDLLKSKQAARKTLKTIQMLFGLVFGGFMTLQTFRIVSTQFSSGETTPVLLIPLWIVNFGYLLGSVLFLVFALRKLVEVYLPHHDAK